MPNFTYTLDDGAPNDFTDSDTSDFESDNDLDKDHIQRPINCLMSE